jgi:hypothetical protein
MKSPRVQLVSDSRYAVAVPVVICTYNRAEGLLR